MFELFACACDVIYANVYRNASVLSYYSLLYLNTKNVKSLFVKNEQLNFPSYCTGCKVMMQKVYNLFVVSHVLY